MGAADGLDDGGGVTTVLRIPTEDMLVDLHRIARRHQLAVDIIDMGEPEPGQAPYRWRLAVTKAGSDDVVVGMAMRSVGDLDEAVRAAWQTFVEWGVV